MQAVTLRTTETPTAQRAHRDARSYAFGLRRVRAPVPSRITERVCRHVSQSVCPWNVRFASELPDDSPFAPRKVIAGRDARTLVREILAMSQEEFATAFRRSPMKRAKLRGLARNAAVVLGNIGTMEDAPVLQQALDDSETLVHEHAAWTLEKIAMRGVLLR